MFLEDKRARRFRGRLRAVYERIVALEESREEHWDEIEYLVVEKLPRLRFRPAATERGDIESDPFEARFDAKGCLIVEPLDPEVTEPPRIGPDGALALAEFVGRWIAEKPESGEFLDEE